MSLVNLAFNERTTNAPLEHVLSECGLLRVDNTIDAILLSQMWHDRRAGLVLDVAEAGWVWDDGWVKTGPGGTYGP